MRPGWTRTVTVRRAAAAVLALLALLLAATSRRDGPTATVVAAAGELAPGGRLTSADVRTLMVPAGLVPADALRSPDDAVGRSVTGPVAPGEWLTSRRLLTDRTAAHVRPGSRLVPVTLSDAAVMDLLRPGDAVDVVAQLRSGNVAEPQVLAHDAIVAVAPGAPGGGPVATSTRARVAMLAMAEDEAHAVAAAALSSPLSVVFR